MRLINADGILWNDTIVYGRMLVDKQTIDRMSTIDPTTFRPHGEWKNIEVAIVDTTGNCSRCGKEAVWRTRNKSYALCPNCGADMRGKSECLEAKEKL